MSAHGTRTGMRPAHEELRRLRLLWMLGCVTPLIYLLIAHGVDLAWFRKSGGGLMTLSDTGHGWLLHGFATAGIVLAAVVLTLRALPARRAPVAQSDPAAGLRGFRRRVLAMVALSDFTAGLGLILFLLTGDLRAVLAGGITAYLLYAVSYPSRVFFARAAKLL